MPGIRPCAVVQGVAYGVVGDGLPIKRRQQVRTVSVAVGIGAACCPSAKTIIPPRQVPDPPGREVFPRAAGFQIACVPRPAVVEKSKCEANGK